MPGNTDLRARQRRARKESLAEHCMRIAMLLAGLALATPSNAQGSHVQDSSAQSELAARGATTPAELASMVLRRFESGTPEAFDSVYADPGGRAELRRAIAAKLKRRGDLARIVQSGSDRAVLLLTGTILTESSSEQANLTREFSGYYEARASHGRWKLARKLPFDSASFIRAHTVHADLAPGREISVVDTLAIGIGSPYGFAARLNGRARLSRVELDGKPVEHAFGGNVLWLRGSPRESARLVLAYTLEEEPRGGPDETGAKDSPRRSPPAFGDYHNTDGWLPFFSYVSANHVGRFDVTVRIPEEYHISTSLPQTEIVHDGRRIVHGRSAQPDFLVSLMYNRDWRPRSTVVDGVRIETFTTPSFPFSLDTLAAAFHRIYSVYEARFGPLPGKYLAIVEDRGAGRGGFKVRMNNAIVAGTTAQVLLDRSPIPSAPFAHEIAHAWTMDATGPAANFLREGFATFAESLILGDELGSEVAATHREISRVGYMTGAEGKMSILGNPDNGRVHYAKGMWIFSMLRYVMGDSAFDRGMRGFMAHAGGPAGYEEFMDAMSRAAGRDMRPVILPWLAEKYMPDVHVTVQGERVIFTQTQPGSVFELPLDVELETTDGTVRRTVHLSRRADTLDVSDIATVTHVRLDPDHHFLIQRHMGEVVRFVVRAPDAKKVVLLGVSTPLEAKRDGDDWVVEIPLEEGQYFWAWQIDDRTFLPDSDNPDSSKYGVRRVRGLVPVGPAGTRAGSP
jgi:hypothetical protein